MNTARNREYSKPSLVLESVAVDGVVGWGVGEIWTSKVTATNNMAGKRIALSFPAPTFFLRACLPELQS
jgi:hypothetical protein